MEMCYCHCGSIDYGCMRSCTHIPMQDSFMRAHAYATTQHVLDFSTLLRKNGFAVSMQCSSMPKKNNQLHKVMHQLLLLMQTNHFVFCTCTITVNALAHKTGQKSKENVCKIFFITLIRIYG